MRREKGKNIEKKSMNFFEVKGEGEKGKNVEKKNRKILFKKRKKNFQEVEWGVDFKRLSFMRQPRIFM